MSSYYKFVFLPLSVAFYAIIIVVPVTYGDKISSVWCSPDKMCTFQNLCYHPDSRQFLFVLSAQSILQGLNHSDLNQLELSSVIGHNRMFMNLTVVSTVNELLLGATFENENLFAVQTFKRDNIMHVIHDDLLPIFATYQRLCGDDIETCINKYRLTFVNGQDPGPYAKWYQMFSNNDLLLLSVLDQDKPVACFKEVRIGLARSSLWFSYGFSGVQGRINKPTISGNDLRSFRHFVLNTLNVDSSNDGCAVFVKRTANRRIINEDYVKETIIESMKVPVSGRIHVCLVEVDLLKDTSKQILSAVSKSNLLVGMHGAGMALAVFLPLGATVLEMFPFGIDPFNVSPIMAMCDLDNIGLNYVFWRNVNRSLSIPPSTTDPLGGSITHLPSDRQHEILQLEKVDAVPCCHDPAYLYYMFQDTVVSRNFEKKVFRALKLSDEFYIDDFIFDCYETLKRLWMIPGPVYNIACKYNDDKSVDVTWNDPINSAEFEQLNYEVVAVSGDISVFTGTVHSTELKVYNSGDNKNLKLWIYAKDEGRILQSKDVFYECKLG